MTIAQRLLSALVLTLVMTTAALAQEQRFSRSLEDVKLYGQGEEVEFLFSQPYQGTPFVETRPGSLSLSFNGTGSSKPVRTLRPRQLSLYKEIQVVENRYSTTVNFQLKDGAQDLKNALKFSGEGKLLRMQVRLPSAVAAAVPPAHVATPEGNTTALSTKNASETDADVGRLLLEEMEKRIGGASAETPPGSVSSPSAATGAAEVPPVVTGGLNTTEFFLPVLTMVLALIVIVGGLYGFLFLYNRFFASRLSRFAGGQPIRQLATFHIGPRQRVVVLEIKGEVIACGVTPQQISYLTHLGKPRAPRGGAKSQAAPGGGNPAVSGEVPAPPSGGAVDAVKADPMHQFAEVLKEKVRSLKRIN